MSNDVCSKSYFLFTAKKPRSDKVIEHLLWWMAKQVSSESLDIVQSSETNMLFSDYNLLNVHNDTSLKSCHLSQTNCHCSWLLWHFQKYYFSLLWKRHEIWCFRSQEGITSILCVILNCDSQITNKCNQYYLCVNWLKESIQIMHV